jgi:hypothetical protein
VARERLDAIDEEKAVGALFHPSLVPPHIDVITVGAISGLITAQIVSGKNMIGMIMEKEKERLSRA